MKKLLYFDEFVEKLNESVKKSNLISELYRAHTLSGEKVKNLEDKYCILVSYAKSKEKLPKGKQLLTEHEKYQAFQKTTNRFTQHPANSNIPVQGHYHIVPNKGKKEIYSVNMDGTAHHKKNRGYEVPKKEAEELRSLGVDIPDNRIIENMQIDPSELFLEETFILIE